MRLAKEEIIGLTLASFSVIGVYAAFDHVVSDGAELSRRSPLFGILLGCFCIGLVAYQYRQKSFGDTVRNGKAERPIVFWSVFLAFLVAGLGLIVISSVVIFR
jgi:hypothetical protein